MAAGATKQDRRGFKFYMTLGMIMIILSIFCIVFASGEYRNISIGACVFGVLTLVLAERLSQTPANNPADFMRFFQYTEDRRPVLVCLGDSLTHGKWSSDYTRLIVPKLCDKLKMETTATTLASMGSDSSRETFEKPVWVVNAGQNYLTSWGMLNERLHPVMDCYPDYVIFFVGTDEIMSLYGGPRQKKALMQLWNMKNEISMENFEKNLRESVDYVLQASPMTLIGIVSLPPMGEDLTHPVNRVVKQANSLIYDVANNYDDRRVSVIPLYDKIQDLLMTKPKRWNNIPIGWSSMMSPVNIIPLLYFCCGMSYNTISKLFSHDVYVDGYHFNERGANIVADYIVQWLVDRNVQKAIAVKSF